MNEGGEGILEQSSGVMVFELMQRGDLLLR